MHGNAHDNLMSGILTKLQSALTHALRRSGIRPDRTRPPQQVDGPGNHVLDDLLAMPVMPRLMTHVLDRFANERIVMAGDPNGCFFPVFQSLQGAGRPIEWRAFLWTDSPEEFIAADDQRVILTLLPVTADEWSTTAALKQRFGERLHLLTELLLPFTRISFLQTRLHYDRPDLTAILPFYLGEKKFGPLGTLDDVFPLRGRSIIEFGPFDGCQTAGLVHLGAASITCIEARAENATKTRTAVEVFGWNHVQVRMDDFHNADASKYGRYDLAFAHGVYYHSIAPFVFLENLRTLADHIFLGGFCATDESPAVPWMELSYEGRAYRVKPYWEKNI